MSRASGGTERRAEHHLEVEIDLAADAAARAGVEDLVRGDDSRRLEGANRLRHAADTLVTELVLAARDNGSTWAEIGEILGVSTQAAHQKYRYAGTDDE
ncbi:MAG: hypothetical protein OSA99_05580 [Acidimicrobiales bacterium]|nr:hypothetical protein [Acidimicrobiales bacterium]